jgi:hypothetical protein
MDELDDEPIRSQNQKNSVQAENKTSATEKTPPNTDIDPARESTDRYPSYSYSSSQCLQQYAQYSIAQYKGSAISPQYIDIRIVLLQYAVTYIILLTIY